MTIFTYENVSEPIVMNKTLHNKKEIDGIFRNDFNVMYPVFDIASENLPNFNYIFIPDFARYYYVDSVQNLLNGLWSISCSVDVLMSYKNQILAQRAIIARQENVYNLYLDDDRLITTCRRRIWTKAFPTRVFPASEGGSSFVLTVAGGAETTE